MAIHKVSRGKCDELVRWLTRLFELSLLEFIRLQGRKSAIPVSLKFAGFTINIKRLKWFLKQDQQMGLYQLIKLVIKYAATVKM